ncbi:LppU/SCO3897 family protein [Streptomyces antarcticus]|uniref:LppU/SCO3897 family protein n=1 Tax=Streptomyces antarcticus TaxID=2996458 RepID=UPI00226FCE39|nr:MULTISPECIES: hypothetical protein [unclassified Streptomyces]MCY0941485.1 hypothetical protein [Streptomyces sp. H34-AA3]MCZ4084892.1 hypothetical protein [Streptomyces sp. H34-S5]
MTLTVRVPVLVALVGGGGRRAPPAVGECVRNEGDWRDQDLRVTQCGPVSAGFEVTRLLDPPGVSCADGKCVARLEYGPGGRTARCLRPLR